MKDTHERILELTRAGVSAREIARLLDIHIRTVGRVRKANGLAKPYHRLTDDEKAWAQQVLDEGVSIHDVANTLGCAHSTVKKVFPQYLMTHQQVIELAALGRQLARIERNNHGQH